MTLNFVLKHPETFAAGIAFSSASYEDLPPQNSSSYQYPTYVDAKGEFGPGKWRELSYTALIDAYKDQEIVVALYMNSGDHETLDIAHHTRFSVSVIQSLGKNQMITYSRDEDISFEECREFLTRTDLGSQYPKERFKERLTKSLKNRSIGITARNEDGLLVGIAFAITDFAYFLFLTDLGVDRSYVKQGIGTELMKRIQEGAGGEDDITVVTVSNDEAYGFYEKSGLKNQECLFWKCCKQWTEYTVK